MLNSVTKSQVVKNSCFIFLEQPEPRESVLHFAARLGLARVAGFMIGKPGSREAIQLRNKNGELPKDVALAHQNFGLAELLSE